MHLHSQTSREFIQPPTIRYLPLLRQGCIPGFTLHVSLVYQGVVRILQFILSDILHETHYLALLHSMFLRGSSANHACLYFH